MSDVFSFLIAFLVDGKDYYKVAIDIKSGYIPSDQVQYFREPEIESQIKKLIPLHVFNPQYNTGFRIVEVTRLDAVVSIEKTTHIQGR